MEIMYIMERQYAMLIGHNTANRVYHVDRVGYRARKIHHRCKVYHVNIFTP